jgi:exodeoxyribonuclease V gamma subunit
MSFGLTLHVGDDLDTLCSELAAVLQSSPGPVLEPTWIVVPSAAIRQWLDARLSTKWATLNPTSHDGVAANIKYLFPEEFVRTVESAALAQIGMTREVWDVATVTLAQLAHLSPRPRYERARRYAEAIDLLMRWRENDLRSGALSTPAAREAGDVFRQLLKFRSNPLKQRDQVRDVLVAQRPDTLPARVILFGLASIPGGDQFVQLLSQLSTHCDVQVLWATPSLVGAREAHALVHDDRDVALETWKRESRESLQLWRSVNAEWNFLAPHESSSGSLGVFQRTLIDEPSPETTSDDRSVQIVSCVGRSRQVEVLRDLVLDAVCDGVLPHEILVLSPDPSAFANAFERHWNYERHNEQMLPRLAYEMTDSETARLRTKLRLSLVLLHSVGNYITRAQMEELCAFDCVQSALGLDIRDLERLWTLATLAPVTFGVSPQQRAAHDVFGRGDSSMRGDAGTWQRLFDRVVAAAIDPCESPDDALGVADDLSLVARLSPLLRLLEEASPYRRQSNLDPLSVWLERLENWMRTISTSDDDASFERAAGTVRGWTTASGSPVDLDVQISFEEFSLLWSDLASSSVQQRVFGRRGVVVAPMTSLQFAPYEMVCILGLDEDLLPVASWSNSILGERQTSDPEPRTAVLAGALAASLSARRRLVVTYSGKDETTGRSVDRAVALDEWLDVLKRANAHHKVFNSSRHSFSVAGDDPLFILDSFDARTRDEVPLAISAATVTDEPSVSRDELDQFLMSPVNFFVRRTLGAQIPHEAQADGVVPPITVSPLHRYSLQRAYVEQLAAALHEEFLTNEVIPLFRHFDHAPSVHCSELDCSWLHRETARLRDALLMSEAAISAVPPSLWHHRLKLPLLELAAYNFALDLGDLVDSSATLESREVIELSDGVCVTSPSLLHSAASAVKWRRAPDGSLVNVAMAVRSKTTDEPRHLLRLVGQLLMQQIDYPGEQVAITTYYLPDRAEPYLKRKQDDVLINDFARNPFITLRYRGTANNALNDLSVLVDLCRRSRSAVVPLFSRTSVAFVRDGHKQARAAWQNGYSVPGESHSGAHRLLFPSSYDDLTALFGSDDLPLANELRRAFERVEICEMSQSKRPPAVRWRESHANLWSGVEITPKFVPLLTSQVASS